MRRPTHDEERRGPVLPPYRLDAAWNDYIERWCKKKGQDFRRVQYVANHWLAIMGKGSDVSKWKRIDIQFYEDQRRATGVMGATIRREMSLMQAALNFAKRWEMVDRVPHFEKPSGEARKRRPLTEGEYKRLMASALPRRIRMFYLLAYWTGHRSRAIETLPWTRVNFEARTLDFNEPGARKTNKRRVDGFPIPDELLPRLVSAKEYADKFRPNDPYVIGLGPRGKCSTTYHQAKAALRAVGIDESGICRHTMRKTFVTERIKKEMSADKVAALIGDNAGTMRKHYLLMETEDLRATANMTKH